MENLLKLMRMGVSLSVGFLLVKERQESTLTKQKRHIGMEKMGRVRKQLVAFISIY